MKRKRRIEKAAVTGMLACLVVACESGGPDGITEDEAMAIVELVGNVTIGPLVGLSVGAADLGGSATNDRDRGRSGEFDRKRECPGGGTVRVSGTMSGDRDERGGTREMRVTTEFDGCTRTSRDGVTMSLTGIVEKELTKTVTYEDSVVSIGMDGTWTGSVAWENLDDGTSGVCEIDVIIDIDMVIDRENRSRELEGGVTGTVCGVEVNTKNRRGWLRPLF